MISTIFSTQNVIFRIFCITESKWCEKSHFLEQEKCPILSVHVMITSYDNVPVIINKQYKRQIKQNI